MIALYVGIGTDRERNLAAFVPFRECPFSVIPRGCSLIGASCLCSSSQRGFCRYTSVQEGERCAVPFRVSAAVDRASNVGDRRTKEFPAWDIEVSTNKVTISVYFNNSATVERWLFNRLRDRVTITLCTCRCLIKACNL